MGVITLRDVEVTRKGAPYQILDRGSITLVGGLWILPM